jgi:hypothetical protein
MSDLIKLVRTYRLTAGLAERLRLADEIFRLIEPDLRVFVFSGVSPDAAKDALQEVLRAVAISLKNFRGDTEKEFWGWSYRIARNKINDHFRSKAADRTQPVAPDELWQLMEVSALQGPLRPGIPIGMQRNARNPQSLAALLKFRGPVASTHRAKVWKEWTSLRTPFQDGLDFHAEPNQRGLDVHSAARLQFCPRVANRTAVPVHIFRQQTRRVRLRRARIARRVVEGIPRPPGPFKFAIPFSYPAFSFCKDMRSDLLSHPCARRVRDRPVPDSERELKSLKISLKIWPGLH